METLLLWLANTPLAYPLLPATLFFGPVVASAIAIAYVVHRRRDEAGTFRKFLFPARIYRSPDFRTDLAFFLINRTFYPILVLLWLFHARDVAEPAAALLEEAGLTRPTLEFGTVPLVLFTALIFVARDFGTFFGHWLHHKSAWLWEFHKVHHTTRALNPFSALRAHPVDDLVTITVSELCAAPVLVAFVWAFGDAVGAWTILGVHGFVLLFRMAGYPLRHSHVWLSFGPRWGRLFISPAHHQIHHSRAPEHWDRNMGKILAIWDSLFGTLHVPEREPQPIAYGVSEAEDARFDSVPALYLQPLRSCAARIVAAWPRGSAPAPPPVVP